MRKIRALKHAKWPYLIFIIGIGTLSVRTLLDSRFANSAILYIAIPFLVSFLLFQFTPKVERLSPWRRYIAHLRDATIVMLATSAFLFEGFICVLFFMPIYYVGASMGFVFDIIATHNRNKNAGKLRVSIIPLIVALMAMEGVSPSLSFERLNTVTRTVIVDATIDELKANMAAPIDLPARKSWFLSVFPLPVDVQAGSLKAGDIHTLKFIYKRWFFTNIDEGEFRLRIDHVDDYQILTSVISNTSYLSNYLEIKGTKVEFTPISEDKTEVSLSINYNRLLDPAWYFGPLQHKAISESVDYLIESVIIRNDPKV